MRFSKPIILLSAFIAFFCTGLTMTFADESLTDAIKNGKTSGEVKLWYQTNDHGANNENIFEKENTFFDAGVKLGYVTGSFYGFKAGTTFYAIDDLNAYGHFADKSIHGVPENETWSWLGEAYLSYKLCNTIARVGRQNIKSPLINSDEWALWPVNFEACMLENKDIKDTTITIGYVTNEKSLKSERFEDIAEDGIVMVGAVNNALPNTKLSAYYYYVDDHHNKEGVYLDANTKISMFNLAAQYIIIDPDESGADETQAFGGKISADMGLFELTAAACTTDRGTERIAKLSDNGIKTPLYTATLSGDGDIAGAADTDSFKGVVTVKPLKGLKITASYAHYHHGSKTTAVPHKNAESFELMTKYSVNNNLTLFGSYINSDHYSGAWTNDNPHDNLNTIRCWAKYAF